MTVLPSAGEVRAARAAGGAAARRRTPGSRTVTLRWMATRTTRRRLLGVWPCWANQCQFEGSPLVGLYPTKTPPVGRGVPLMVFMHGTAAKIEMYLPNLLQYASHGYVVVFPYIVSPQADCCRRLYLNKHERGVHTTCHSVGWEAAANACIRQRHR